MLSGAICGVGDGPPCETFSAARLLPDGPPPLRSYDHLSGLPWNSKRGWLQTQVGSALMHFIFTMVVLAARIGGCAFVENPAFPAWAARLRLSSIWASKVVRLLRRLECTQVITFDQCVYHCPARKPTTLLLIRLPKMVSNTMPLGSHGRCHHPRGWHQALAGHDSQGAFRTSIAKVYPEAVNEALATSIADFALKGGCHGQWVDPLLEAFVPMLSFEFVDRTTVQPDHYVQIKV